MASSVRYRRRRPRRPTPIKGPLVASTKAALRSAVCSTGEKLLETTFTLVALLTWTTSGLAMMAEAMCACPICLRTTATSRMARVSFF